MCNRYAKPDLAPGLHKLSRGGGRACRLLFDDGFRLEPNPAARVFIFAFGRRQGGMSKSRSSNSRPFASRANRMGTFQAWSALPSRECDIGFVSTMPHIFFPILRLDFSPKVHTVRHRSLVRFGIHGKTTRGQA